jgi:hypothetical protein
VLKRDDSILHLQASEASWKVAHQHISKPIQLTAPNDHYGARADADAMTVFIAAKRMVFICC